MKFCSNCGNQIADDAVFCPFCGSNTAVPGNGAPANNGSTIYAPPAPYFDPYDHTADFDPKDISDNKVISMLVYLMGIFGVLIALLASRDSAYAGFHVRQSLKFTVVEILVGIITALLCWTVIVPIAAAVVYVILLVLKVIAFFSICSGKAKEPAIIRNLGFLK